jgi:hypothetical protein
MVERPRLRAAVAAALERAPVVALVGPRQVGKTTLARTFLSSDSANYFDLEVPAAEVLLANPMLALESRTGLVVVDEVQRAPDVFKVLRVLCDRDPLPCRFLLLGSAAPGLLQQTAETLAGRIEVIEIGGFALDEVGPDAIDRLWLRGGFPRSFTAAREADSRRWRQQFVRTFVERDLPLLGFTSPPAAMRRFWALLAHWHGQIWNAAEPARTLGVTAPTVRRLLDWLAGTFMVRTLPPWHENLGKRQVKAPKVYLRDSGLLHELLGIPDHDTLLVHPKAGASWEGFALESVLAVAQPDDAYFWATHGGAELDLLLLKDGKRVGVEFKRADAPRLTPSITTALHDLRLDALYVVYPGTRRYPLAERVEVVPLTALTA